MNFHPSAPDYRQQGFLPDAISHRAAACVKPKGALLKFLEYGHRCMCSPAGRLRAATRIPGKGGD